jgi:hypothetical protein
MEGPKSRLQHVDNLSTELQTIKNGLEDMLELNLNKLDARKDLGWAQKQKLSTQLIQACEDFWLSQLTAAGIVVSPAFESVENEPTEETLCEEFKAYENLWD